MIYFRQFRRILVCALVAAVCHGTAARAEPPIEYQLQAAYVSKFLRFVDWPPGAVEQGVFVVGVSGSSDFWDAMRALDGHTFGDTRVTALRLDDSTPLDGIHALVIDPADPSARARRLVQGAADQPILTVGQSESFAQAGGIIRFVPVDDTLRFEINTDAAKRAGLRVSSRLLRLARNQR